MIFVRRQQTQNRNQQFQSQLEEYNDTIHQQVEWWPDIIHAVHGVNLSGILTDQLLAAIYECQMVLSIFTQLEKPALRRVCGSTGSLRGETKSLVHQRYGDPDNVVSEFSRRLAGLKIIALNEMLASAKSIRLPTTIGLLDEMLSLENRFLKPQHPRTRSPR